MARRSYLMTSCLLTLSLTGPAVASDSSQRPVAGAEPIRYASYARVISSRPILSKRYERTPVRRCHTVRNASRRYGDEPLRRCRTTHESRLIENITGYQVRYRYAGEIFERVMSRDPGDRIYVSVKVVPLRP